MIGFKHLKIWVGGIILVVLFVCGVASPLLAPHDPQAQTLEDRLRPPRWAENGSPAYLLGTDNLGRDILSRIIYGSRISLLVGAATVIFAGLIGCTLGAVAGYFGNVTDDIVSKISEIFLAFPFLLIAIAIMAFLGQGVVNLIMALMLSRWVQYCRVVRGEVLSIKERDFVTAVKALGGRDGYVLLRHVVPNTVASITVIATFAMAIVIIRRAGAYPDVGVDAERRQELYQSRPLADDFPGLGHFYHRVRHQSFRRRFEGYLRPEIAQTEIIAVRFRRIEWLVKKPTSAVEIS
jgi:peptide/nickel transport system permease protein